MKLDDITVVVPTRNEERNILAFLRSLPPSIRLIVVDASQDATPELISAHRPEHTLVLRHPGMVSEARQFGAERAQTAWLLFTDADVIFAPDFFERVKHYHGYDVIYGPKLSTGEYARYYRWFARGQGLCHRLGIPAASGSNLLISRHAFFTGGGFDLHLTCNEDSEIAWRIKRLGYPVSFAPDLVVYARDHCRLRRGLMRKTVHSIVRCLLLFSNLMPTRWRSHDWGYWSHVSDVADSDGVAPGEDQAPVTVCEG